MPKNKSKPILMMFSGLLSVGLSYAQESANASGGNAIGSGGTLAYSVGQIFFTTNTGSTGSVAQGVQHGYEIYLVGIKETTLNISLNVFPNPTTENLILQIDNFNKEKLSYQLHEMQGKLLDSGQVIAQQTSINVSSLPIATYFIVVYNQENKIIQSFKINKN